MVQALTDRPRVSSKHVAGVIRKLEEPLRERNIDELTKSKSNGLRIFDELFVTQMQHVVFRYLADESLLLPHGPSDSGGDVRYRSIRRSADRCCYSPQITDQDDIPMSNCR